MVDDSDYERVMELGSWRLDRYVKRTKYIATVNGKQIAKTILLHRFIMNPPIGVQVDHIDRDVLNNQKSNLRLCSSIQNSYNRNIQKSNTSGYKGVVWVQKKKRWRAVICFDSKTKSLGYHKCKHEAARAYNAAALIHHGEFARLNEILE